MAIVTQTINVDLRPHYNRRNQSMVYCSQYDNDLRNIVLNIANEGVPVDVSTYTIYIEGTKPDKHGFSYELTSIGGSVSNNVITVPLQTQMTAVAGLTNAEVVLYSNDERIGSANFILNVEKAGLAEDVDISKTDIPAYVDGAQQAAAEATQAKNDAVSAKDTAVSAAETAQDVLDSIPADYSDLSDTVDDLKSAITEETRNLFSLDGLQLGKNSVGSNMGSRAVSKEILVSSKEYTVSCDSLPPNLKYDIEAYSSDDITDRVKGITDWITSTTPVTTKTPDGTYTYIRILFGSVNNANLTTADFEGLKLQVEFGSAETPYVNPITAVDIVARAEIAEMVKKDIQKLKVMQFNVGHYSYGVQEGYSGDDAADVFKRYQLWLNDNACDIANINEYERYFTSDHTISAKADLFDPVFKYAYNNLVTTLFSRYELLGQTWGYLGSSDPTTQRYYVKAYVRINGVQLCLVGCHLSPAIEDAPAKRAVQIADLLALVQNDTNVIICGDFNVATTAEYQPFIDAGYKMANGGNIGYFTTSYTGGSDDLIPIDNIIVSPNIYITNIQCHSDDYSKLTSDHYAVTCDLTIYPAN